MTEKDKARGRSPRASQNQPANSGTTHTPHCTECGRVRAMAKQIISDLLGELFNLDVRKAMKLSRRVERLCPWLKET